MTRSRVLLLVAAGLGGALYTACVLPSEPSRAERIRFRLDFPLPYRVPLGIDIEPAVRVLANGREVPYADYRLETLAPNIVRAVGRTTYDTAGVPSTSPQRRVLRGAGRGAGTVRVSYATGTGTPDTVFSVQVVISSITVRAALDTSPAGLTLTQLKQQRTLTALAYDANNQLVPTVPFTWATTNATIVTVDSSGRVTAESEGTATITAQADGVLGSASITVVQAAARVLVLPELDTLRTVSRTRQFEAFAFDSSNSPMRPVKVTWRSTNPAVATVDAAGLAVAESAGTALIIAQVGPAADTASLNVKQVVRYVKITPEADTLTAIDDTNRFVAQPQDSLRFDVHDAPAVTWATADPAIATVEQGGLVQARKNGLVIITASVAGQTGPALVLVRQEIDSVRIVEDSVGLAGENATVRLNAQGFDRNGYAAPEGRFAWSSTLAFVATVNDTGLVTARGDGRTRVMAAPEKGGPSDTAVVTVTGAPQQLIAFESPQGIEMIRFDGSLRTTVIPVTSDYYYYNSTWYSREPAWSRDGARLAYVVEYTYYYYNSSWSIYTAWADGSASLPVTSEGVFHGGPAWSPDGTKIVFSRDAGSGWNNLYVMNADGSALVRLTNIEANDYEPAWSPDGTKIAFQSNRDGNPDNWEIYVMNADGSSATRLTNDAAADLEPAWSPDGLQLAFARGNDIWLMNSDGSGARNLTVSPPESEHDPAWSPDGSHIVFDRYRCTLGGCTARDLYVVSSSDGTGLRRLTTGANAIRPAWRPPTPLTPPPAAPALQVRRGSAP